MVNVLLAIESLARRGGTETQIFELMARVDPSRFRLHVCVFEEGELPAEAAGLHTVQVFPMRKVNSLAGVRQIFRMRAYIREHRIDIVQTFMFKASFIAVLAAWGTRCRAIVTSRRSLDFANGHPRMIPVLNRLTDRVLANSESAKNAASAAEGLDPSRIDVLYNGVDLERFRRSPEPGSPELMERLGIPRGSPVVGIVANLRPVKDIPFFLEMAREVASVVENSSFLIIGDGPLRQELEAYAVELGIRNRVFFAGSITDVPAYLPHVAVGCLCSLAEGFSNAILEFMAAGVPVVATAVGGNAEAIAHGATGFLLQGRSVKEFADYVVRLLRDAELRAAMGWRARQSCRERFEVAGMVRRYEEYWTNLLEDSR